MTAKLVISIPTLTGYVSAWTMASVQALFPQGDFIHQLTGLINSDDEIWTKACARLANAFDIEVLDTWLWPYDLARTRSRAVRKFLETDGTHLLFVDADIQFEPYLIRKMLNTGCDVVSAPYPKRDIRWDLAYDAAREGKSPEIGAYEYVFRALDVLDSRRGLIKVSGVGMGCTLISRSCLEGMTARFGSLIGPNNELPDYEHEDLRAWDNHPTEGGDTVMLFAMQWGKMNGRRHLFGEDMSFCNRWRTIGGECFLYVGDGAPASHYGGHWFRGTQEGMARDMARGDEGRKRAKDDFEGEVARGH